MTKRTTLFLATILSTTVLANAQVIISDDYTGSGTGFALDSGVNSGINPPPTRLTGSAADGLRYIEVGNTPDNLYSLTGNKLQVDSYNNIGAVTLSADGINAFNFASVLGAGLATPSSPVTYDISISMANAYGGGRPRFSFGFGTLQPVDDGIGDAGAWDFGLQLYKNFVADGGTGYTIGKRIDLLSGEGLGVDLNAPIISNLGAGTYGSEIDFLIRVTDAGAETDSYNSRIQVSMDGGSTFFYDTEDDSAITGFRFDDSGRYFTWDMAGNANNGGIVTYDNFSVTVPEPSTLALAGLGGAALLFLRRRFKNPGE